MNQEDSGAYILQAEIFLAKEKYAVAMSSLDMALSHDFEVRNNVLFHLLKATCLMKLGNVEECVKDLQTAFQIKTVKEFIGCLI